MENVGSVFWRFVCSLGFGIWGLKIGVQGLEFKVVKLVLMRTTFFYLDKIHLIRDQKEDKGAGSRRPVARFWAMGYQTAVLSV